MTSDRATEPEADELARTLVQCADCKRFTTARRLWTRKGPDGGLQAVCEECGRRTGGEPATGLMVVTAPIDED